jgi:hypothetical protein
MGEYSKTTAVRSGKWSNIRSRQTHHVGISSQENSRGTKSTLGKGESSEQKVCLTNREREPVAVSTAAGFVVKLSPRRIVQAPITSHAKENVLEGGSILGTNQNSCRNPGYKTSHGIEPNIHPPYMNSEVASATLTECVMGEQ